MPRVEHQRRALSPARRSLRLRHARRAHTSFEHHHRALEDRGLLTAVGNIASDTIGLVKNILGLGNQPQPSPSPSPSPSPNTTTPPSTPPSTPPAGPPATTTRTNPPTTAGPGTTQPPQQQQPTVPAPGGGPAPIPTPDPASPPSDPSATITTPAVPPGSTATTVENPAAGASSTSLPTDQPSDGNPTDGTTPDPDGSTGSPDTGTGQEGESSDGLAESDLGPVAGVALPSGIARSSRHVSGKTHATVTTDSNGNVIPIETGTSSGPGGSPPPLPVSARVGIGLFVTCAVVLLCALCFVLHRKRRIARRNDRRQRWWSSRRPASQEYRDYKEPLTAPDLETAEERDSVISRLSAMPSPLYSLPNVAFGAMLPAPPPMAEIRNSLNMIDYSPPNSPSPSDSRFSIGSLGSQDASSLMVLGGSRHSLTTTTSESETPSRSRPTSPSLQQHFTFPAVRPPTEAAIDRTSAYFQPRVVSMVMVRSMSSDDGNSTSASVPETIIIVPRTTAATTTTSDTTTSSSSCSSINPFVNIGGNTLINITTQLVTAPSHGHGFSTSSSGETDLAPASIIASSCYGVFEEFEQVRVPIIGTLSDELSLRRGDEVRVLRIFDDGWAVVEKSFGSQDAERGVIPLACLRAPRPFSGAGGSGGGMAYPARGDSYTTSSAYLRS